MGGKEIKFLKEYICVIQDRDHKKQSKIGANSLAFVQTGTKHKVPQVLDKSIGMQDISLTFPHRTSSKCIKIVKSKVV